jgi:hypothetical protein
MRSDRALQIVFDEIKYVGRDAAYKMAQFLQSIARVSLAVEPFYMVEWIEKTKTAGQVAEAFLSVCQEMGMYANQPLNVGGVASEDQIEEFLKVYFGDQRRSSWSPLSRRESIKTLLIKRKICRGELELFKRSLEGKSKLVPFSLSFR